MWEERYGLSAAACWRRVRKTSFFSNIRMIARVHCIGYLTSLLGTLHGSMSKMLHYVLGGRRSIAMSLILSVSVFSVPHATVRTLSSTPRCRRSHEFGPLNVSQETWSRPTREVPIRGSVSPQRALQQPCPNAVFASLRHAEQLALITTSQTENISRVVCSAMSMSVLVPQDYQYDSARFGGNGRIPVTTGIVRHRRKKLQAGWGRETKLSFSVCAIELNNTKES